MKTKRSKGSSPRVAAGRKIRTQLLRIELVSDGAQKATGDSEHDTQDERSNPSRMFPELHKLKLFKYQTPFNFPLPLISSLKPLIRSQKQGESGRFGKKCRVETNYFVVSLRDSDVYQYDVCISPEDRSCVVNRAVMRKLVSIHKSALNGCFPAYDGRNRLYTAISLPFTCKTFQIELQSIDQASCRKRKFEVVIKFVTNVRLQAVGHESEPKIDLQALEVILFEMFRRSCSIGKPFERGKGLEIQLSFNKNLQLTQKGLLLNIDVSSKVSMNSIHAEGQLNQTQISTSLKAPPLHPLERKYQILQAVKGNSYEEPYAKEFGIEIKKEPVSIDARVLPPPWLKFLDDAGGTKLIFPQAGRWNMIRKRMFNGGRVSNWTCLNFSCDVENEMVRSFCHELAVVCKASGMAFCPDPVIPVRTANPEDLELTLDLCYGEAMSMLQPLGRELDLLVVILPNNKGSLYGNLKRICETKIGLVSQCCLAKHVSRTSKQYLTNVALKINVKVGGRNTVLADSWRLPCVGDIPTIIFGGHVMHPERSNSPSIAAVVASQDWPDVTSYAALADVQASGQEWIRGLFGVSHFSGLGARTGGMIIEHLKSFYRKTGQKPQRIIYYRDSLSDKQRYQVMLQEVIAIKKACSYLEPGYMPSVTYVVLQKRRHARFFTEYNERERGRMFNGSGNVLPGTVVDSDICHPNEFGFYLCSQIGTQGTIQPVHYHILWDENSFVADTFQCLTNYLCYTYARCMHSVSIVPPVFYAHLMASRCRLYMDHTTEKVEGGQAPSPSEASSSWTIRLPTIKDNVKQGMFYC